MAQPDRPVPPEIEPGIVAQALSPAAPAMSSAAETHRRAMLPAWLRTLPFTLVGLFIFMLALQLTKQGAKVYGAQIINSLHITNMANSLGFGWLLAYIFLSGSPVAVRWLPACSRSRGASGNDSPI